MSKPVFEDVFWPKGRRNRVSYTLFMLAIWAVFLAFTLLLVLVGASASENVGTAVAIFWLVSIVPLTWMMVSATVQRLHDLGRSGWPAAVLFVPYLNVVAAAVLAILPGTEDPNRWGTDPRGRQTMLSAAANPGFA